MSCIAGSISSKLFDRLQDFGFTPIQNIQEIIDNSIDAGAKNIDIIVEREIIENENDKYKLYIIDNGKGMDKCGLIKYFDLAEDKTKEELFDKFPIGSKGMGGKIAIINLTNRGSSTVVSRTNPNPKSWLESYYDWNNEQYNNNVMINIGATLSNDQLIKHIFNDILKCEAYPSFTLISLDLSTDMYNNLFSDDKLTNVDDSIYLALSISYCKFIKNGLKIRIRNGEMEKTIIPIDLLFPIPSDSLSDVKKNSIINTPKTFEKILIPKNKNQKEGDPDFTKYYNQVFIKKNQKYILCKDNTIYEMNEIDEDNIDYYKLTGNSGKNQYNDGRFNDKEKVLIDTIEEIYKNKLVEFNITLQFNNDFNQYKELIEKEYSIKFTDSLFMKKFYGTFIERNQKIMNQPIQEFKEITTGDYYKRKWNQVQYLLQFQSNSHDIDKHFGVMVNKGSINSSTVNNSISKLINYSKYSFDQILEKDYREKISLFNHKNKITTEQTMAFKENEDDKELIPKNSLENECNSGDSVSLGKSNNNISKSTKCRKKLPNKKKDVVLAKQGNKERHTGIAFIDYLRCEVDHIDGNRTNDELENLQALTPNLHSIKTNDEPLYNKIIKNPHIYNITMAHTYLDSQETLAKLSEKQQLDIVKAKDILNMILSELNKDLTK